MQYGEEEELLLLNSVKKPEWEKKLRSPSPKYEVNIILDLTETRCGVDSSHSRECWKSDTQEHVNEPLALVKIEEDEQLSDQQRLKEDCIP